MERTPQQWVDIEVLAEELHLSTRTLGSYIRQGLFQAGFDYYRAGIKKGKYFLYVERCRQRLLDRTRETNSIEIEIYDEAHLANRSREVASA